MRVIGIGVDIVEIARIATIIERHGERFLHRVYTAAELACAGPMRDRTPYYAARFAAKEAVSKAFGTGIRDGLGWLQIEVGRRTSGAPTVTLHGSGAALAERLGIIEVQVSLSHSEHYAVANALAIGE